VECHGALSSLYDMMCKNVPACRAPEIHSLRGQQTSLSGMALVIPDLGRLPLHAATSLRCPPFSPRLVRIPPINMLNSMYHAHGIGRRPGSLLSTCPSRFTNFL
jgi:hypothetical protein